MKNAKLANNTVRLFNTAEALIVTIAVFVLVSIATIVVHAYDYTNACDVNKDGVIDVSDGVLYSRFVTRDPELIVDKYIFSDCNGDGEQTIADVVFILQVIAKMEPLPVTTTVTSETTTTPPIPWIPADTTTTTTASAYEGDAYTFFTETITIDFQKKDGKPVYAYSDESGVWFFTITGEGSQYEMLMDPTKIQSVDKWMPTDEELSTYEAKFESVPSFADPAPELSAFHIPGRIRAYELKSWDKIDAAMIDEAMRYVMSGKSTGETKIAKLDYVQDQKVDTLDIVIMVRYYAINLANIGETTG